MSQHLPATYFGNNIAAWEGLGAECHARFYKNYARWACGYPHTIPRSSPVSRDDLAKSKPLDWTVGASTPTHVFFDNRVTATKNGISIGVIPGMHFPSVLDPEAFPKHVIGTTRRYS